MSKIEKLRPSGLHNNPAYSHVVRASGARTIYLAGQVSTDEEGRVVGEGDLAAQTTQVMQNIGLALKSAGATYADIVKITTFVVGYKPELRPIIGKARSAFFEGIEPPASTLVGVSALAAPEWLICGERRRSTSACFTRSAAITIARANCWLRPWVCSRR